MLIKSAAGLLTRTKKTWHTPALASLHWLSCFRIDLKILLITLKLYVAFLTATYQTF